MRKWQLTLCCVVMCVLPGENSRETSRSLLPGKNILNLIPEFLGQSPTTTNSGTSVPELDITTALAEGYSSVSPLEQDQIISASLEMTSLKTFPTSYDSSDPPDSRYPVLHAGVPRGLAVRPMPLEHGDHELVFNVSWLPSHGPPARDYSLEVTSETETQDCRSPLCYEYNIPGDSLWHVIPKHGTPIAETCSLRPGCAYKVRLIAHPWDGHTAAYKYIQLDECVGKVCSCAHSPRLPAPVVQARTLSIHGQIAVNVTWVLPKPRYPLRLPPHLQKKYYFVSIGKQMVSDAHPLPWYANTVTHRINVNGPVAMGDDVRWTVMPIDERSGGRSGGRSGERSGDRDKRQRTIVLDVKLLARVSLVDERGCVGPAGNFTAYDPADARKIQIGTYALWAAFGGACVLSMVAILAVSARAVKRILNAFRPAPISAPLEPLRTRPAWFPLQLRP